MPSVTNSMVNFCILVHKTQVPFSVECQYECTTVLFVTFLFKAVIGCPMNDVI